MTLFCCRGVQVLTSNEFRGLDFSLSLEGVVRNAGLQGDSLLLALNNDPARIGPDLVCMTVLCVMLSAWACLAMVVRGAKGGVCACLCCGSDEAAGAAGGGARGHAYGATNGATVPLSAVSTDVDSSLTEPAGKIAAVRPVAGENPVGGGFGAGRGKE